MPSLHIDHSTTFKPDGPFVAPGLNSPTWWLKLPEAIYGDDAQATPLHKTNTVPKAMIRSEYQVNLVLDEIVEAVSHETGSFAKEVVAAAETVRKWVTRAREIERPARSFTEHVHDLRDSETLEWVPVVVLTLAAGRLSGEPSYLRERIRNTCVPVSVWKLVESLRLLTTLHIVRGDQAEQRQLRLLPVVQRLLTGRHPFERPSPLDVTDEERELAQRIRRTGVGSLAGNPVGNLNVIYNDATDNLIAAASGADFPSRVAKDNWLRDFLQSGFDEPLIDDRETTFVTPDDLHRWRLYGRPSRSARDNGPLCCVQEFVERVESDLGKRDCKGSRENDRANQNWIRLRPHLLFATGLLKTTVEMAEEKTQERPERQLLELCEKEVYEWLPVFVLSVAHERANGEPTFDNMTFQGQPQPASLKSLIALLSVIVISQIHRSTRQLDREIRLRPCLERLLSGHSLFTRPSPLIPTADEVQAVNEALKRPTAGTGVIANFANRNVTDEFIGLAGRASQPSQAAKDRWLWKVLLPIEDADE